MKSIGYFCVAVLSCIFGWHIFLWSQVPRIADVEVNPLTDVVRVYVPDIGAESALGKDFVASFKGARDLVGGAIGDKELESRVRENFDVYAMFLPYHVIFKDKMADVPRAAFSSLRPRPEPSQERPDTPRLREYVNNRFGFTIAVPPGFEASDPPMNGDGIRYTSADGMAKLTMYGSNAGGVTIKEYYDDLATGLGVEPTYSKLADNWFVLSGQKGETIFYTKVFVGSGSLNTFTFEYPAKRADQYRSMIDQLVHSFRHGDLDQAY